MPSWTSPERVFRKSAVTMHISMHWPRKGVLSDAIDIMQLVWHFLVSPGESFQRLVVAP